ncbi:MAG: 4Fe-4S binding protein [Candidatus Methanomethylophilaceae archaeon]|nr:4Fe-4S binding protein [Candidatus Methanomethylophilaceae archaeon]
MMRDVVRIDADRCTGCGACAEACSEGAIKMVDGKAVLVSEEHCDGLGACLPSCPADAIAIERRDVEPFREPGKADGMRIGIVQPSCSGSGPRAISRGAGTKSAETPSRLAQWPVQIRLAPVKAAFFDGCDLLVAADCSAFAYGAFHEDFIKGRTVLIGCPKLDPPECWSRLDEIVASNDIRSITAVRMEVPCCSPIMKRAEEAVRRSGKDVPVRTVILGVDGALR